MDGFSQNLYYLQVSMAGLKHFFEPYPIDTAAFSVHGIGIQEEMRPCIVDRRHGSKDYLLMHFYQPCIVKDKRGESLRPANSFIVWKPSDAHRYGNQEIRWTHSWLHCDGKKIRAWLKKSGVPTNLVLPLNEGTVFERHLELLYQELSGSFSPDKKIARNLVENALRAIGRRITQKETHPLPAWIRETKRRLDADFTLPLRLKDLAGNSHRAIPYFCEQFKRHYGIPVMEYVIRLRLQRAGYLLRDHNLNIGEIGRLVGYEDVYHFSKLFKKRYGLSPRAYRSKQLA